MGSILQCYNSYVFLACRSFTNKQTDQGSRKLTILQNNYFRQGPVVPQTIDRLIKVWFYPKLLLSPHVRDFKVCFMAPQEYKPVLCLKQTVIKSIIINSLFHLVSNKEWALIIETQL